MIQNHLQENLFSTVGIHDPQFSSVIGIFLYNNEGHSCLDFNRSTNYSQIGYNSMESNNWQ